MLSAIALSEIPAFLQTEDVSSLLLSEWIDIRTIGILDMAVTNRMTRVVWLRFLRSIKCVTINHWMHSHASIRWLITRGLRVTSIHINILCRHQISDLTFRDVETGREGGLSQLQHIDIGRCGSVTDAGISALAQGCPLLQTIKTGCV